MCRGALRAAVRRRWRRGMRGESPMRERRVHPEPGGGLPVQERRLERLERQHVRQHTRRLRPGWRCKLRSRHVQGSHGRSGHVRGLRIELDPWQPMRSRSGEPLRERCVHRRILRAVSRIVGTVSMAALVGCGSPANEGPSDASVLDGGESCKLAFCPRDAASDAPLSVQVKDVIDRICAQTEGCHGNGGVAVANLTLGPGFEFLPLIDVSSTEVPSLLRVKPGDPANSYVYRKLACDGGYVDACMPVDAPQPPLANLFYAWIEAGAPTQ
jgi:hypothetical protein